MTTFLLPPAHAGKFSYITSMAAKMPQAFGSMVNLKIDGKTKKLSTIKKNGYDFGT